MRDLLLCMQMRFVFFPSKREVKEIVWERYNVDRTVLATEVEVNLEWGFMKYKRQIKHNLVVLISLFARVMNQAPEHSRDIKSGGTTETCTTVLSCIPSPLQSYLASPPYESDRILHIQCWPEEKDLFYLLQHPFLASLLKASLVANSVYHYCSDSD